MKNDGNINISILFLAAAFAFCALSVGLLFAKAGLAPIMFFAILSFISLGLSQLFLIKSH